MKKVGILVLVLILGVSGLVAAQPRGLMLTEEQQAELGEIWQRKAELEAELREKMVELEIFPAQNLPRRALRGQGSVNRPFGQGALQNNGFADRGSKPFRGRVMMANRNEFMGRLERCFDHNRLRGRYEISD